MGVQCYCNFLARLNEALNAFLITGILIHASCMPYTLLSQGEGGGGGGAECNHHDDVHHMYDVMVKSRPEGLHCQVPMCRKNFQTIKFCQTFFYTLVPENDVSETTAFGKSYIYNQERMRLINQERMSHLWRLMRSWLISLINLLI